MCGRSDKAQVWPLLVVGCAIIEAVDELSYPKLAVRGRISGRAQR